MEGIHPKFVLSKRFPVHAAVEQLNLPELGTTRGNPLAKMAATTTKTIIKCRLCSIISALFEDDVSVL